MSDNYIQKCLACGASLDGPVKKGKIKCAYCGALNVVHAPRKSKEDDVICPECGTANPINAQHCGSCGLALVFNCPKCKALNAYGTDYCVQCGVDIQAEIKHQQEEEQRKDEESRRRRIDESRQQEEVRLRYKEQEKKRGRQRSILVVAATIGVLIVMVCVVIGIIKIPTIIPTTQPPVVINPYPTNISDNTGSQTLFHDNFSNVISGWDRSHNEYGSTDYENSGYRINVIQTDSFFFANPYQSFQNDVSVEVDATKIGGPDDNAFGVQCHYQDVDNYYFFYISSDGYTGIGIDNAGTKTIISSSDGNLVSDSNINQGAATNHIRADCIGSNLTLYVNGTQIATAYDSTFTGGDVGLIAKTFSVAGTDIMFDNFFVYKP